MSQWLKRLLCVHDWPRYFHQQASGVDGVGRHHRYLWRYCNKCGHVQTGYIHVPQEYVDALVENVNNKIQAYGAKHVV